jgi:hypothetical protein
MGDLWRVCRRCLSYEGMQRWLSRSAIPISLRWSFRIDDDGVCNVCKAYDRALDETALARERDAAVAAGRSGAVVAMSGGKDALSTLYLAKVKLGLPVTALLLDNGFLVSRALRQAKRVCRELDVPLVVVTPKGRAQRAFDRAVAHADAMDRHPCEDCSALVADALLAFADDTAAGAVYAGSNYFVAWDKHGVRATTNVGTPKGRDVVFAHLPYAFRLKRLAVLRHVRALGATVTKAPGISSNCRVPALVHARGVVDHVPELEDLSLEVMVGHRSRKSALDELREKFR